MYRRTAKGFTNNLTLDERLQDLNSRAFRRIRFIDPKTEGVVISRGKVVLGDEHPCHGGLYLERLLLFDYGRSRDNPSVLVNVLLCLLDESGNPGFFILDVMWQNAIFREVCSPSCVQIQCFFDEFDRKLEAMDREVLIVPTGGMGSISCTDDTQYALNAIFN